MERPEHCPRCDSPAATLHPAMQHEGEVQPCPHDWHYSDPRYPPEPGAQERARRWAEAP